VNGPSQTPSLLHEHFDRQARQSPLGVALRAGDREATYAELRERSDRVAASLQARGIGSGSLVGLHLDRSIEWVVGMLGILKADAAAVPLHPADPPARRAEIVAYGRLDAVLDREATPFAAAPPASVLRLEQLELERRGNRLPPRGTPEQAAFVLSSSGSTGRPKLIVRSHRSFFHRLIWTWTQHPFGAGDLGCQKAHVTTTHAIYELFEPLLAGAPTLIVPDAETRNLERFWDTVRTRAVTRLLIVPSALRATLELPTFEAPSLSVLVLMGEAVDAELAARARSAVPTSTALYSIYGSTEASSALVTDLRASSVKGEVPLGRPISPDVRALVLGPDLAPVPAGTEGRLHVGGPLLFSGYLHDPEATAATLVRVPGEPEALYDTRDQVRVGTDGTLYFRGRVDHVVKVRGFRVDLAEVERAIEAHPGVRRAAVVAAVAGGTSTLLGFFVPGDLDRAALQRTIQAALPPHMVPSVLTGLEDLPSTASGKVDRVRLMERHAAPRSTWLVGKPPTESEARVARVWEATLGHGRFGLESDFFEIGGTSLNVFTMVHRLREEFAAADRLSVEAMYRLSTVARLARFIDEIRSGAAPRLEGPAPILVSLRKGREDQSPLFVVAAAGGTLGAYEKLARALRTSRAIIGVRDPFVLGERDPTEGFARWVERYLDAIRERQPRGPYYLCAYSSAGAFGYAMAARLRAAGDEVALLALVDPQAMDRRGRAAFGYWTLEAVWMRPLTRALVRLAGRARTPVVRLLERFRTPEHRDEPALSQEEFGLMSASALRDRNHVMNLAALLELNTGLPIALSDAQLDGVAPEGFLGVLAARVASVAPHMDAATIERIAIQYPLQVRAQHQYELRRYDGPVLLVEPVSHYAGLIATLLRPYVRDLRVRAVTLGVPTEREAALVSRFGRMETHYRSMRDDEFVAGLARVLDAALD
jgi:amino acid adenylation domain-containing protein